ncbi:MAG: TetR/AcrR family transcriptional regulator [Methylobacterium mesophilicum]|nr:TetR/AcrR family transcriptional regulator [Methylobacterium mesophilicum]
MAGKVSERREALRQTLVEVAERMVAHDGLSALRARDVAKEAGCALGAIYLHFPDMDALAAAVNARTLQRLEGEVAEAFEAARARDNPKRALATLGTTYAQFVWANPKLWSAIFELGFRQGEPEEPPQSPEHFRLLDAIVAPLRALLPDGDPAVLEAHARALFSAVHGIVSLSQQRRFMAVERDQVAGEIRFIVNAFCDGVSASK